MRLILFAAISMAALTSHSFPVDFDKITHWAGSGPNRAVLIVYDNALASDPTPYVWGFRWEHNQRPTGEDMMKAICAASDELVILTQQTGQYGATLCGVGFGNADKLLENIYFDFEMAKTFEFINFDYYSASSFFGQMYAPGDNTPELCQAAIDEARKSGMHYIKHPIDYAAYGYPAYDYDCWKLRDEGYQYGWWSQGWYTGYWSYWIAQTESTDWLYSGSGFTGRILSDGCIDAWSYTRFDKAQVGGVGEGVPPPADPALYSYRPLKDTGSASAEHTSFENDKDAIFYNLSGQKVDSTHLTPGIYIKMMNEKSQKIIIR